MLSFAPVEQHERDRLFFHQVQELDEQLQRGLVCPMQVVEHDARRTLFREPCNEGAERVDRLALDAVPAERPDALGSVGLELEPEEIGEERVDVVCLRRSRPGERRLQLEPDAGFRGRCADTEPGTQEIAKGPVRKRLGIRDSVATVPFAPACGWRRAATLTVSPSAL